MHVVESPHGAGDASEGEAGPWPAPSTVPPDGTGGVSGGSAGPWPVPSTVPPDDAGDVAGDEAGRASPMMNPGPNTPVAPLS